MISGQSVGRQALTSVEGNGSKALVDDFILATTEERSDGEIIIIIIIYFICNAFFF